MGVPKFYRWISERYPTLSEVVRDYQIPEFDNLYLDMNGIIHTCSHPNDADPHFRITEEQIFKDIFHYIEVLFRMIQPQKVFFMAIDGVAPRAKMNQQRGRRFRSAREAEDSEAKARAKGEVLPSEARFDSNCITPGTEFMDRLDKQLQYFVTEKLSSDSMWRNCKVIYSGHQTPGEGEHKIMEYIRFTRSLPSYDPNIRHCLYGLDADLMMLGLTSHDPHFALLREEVKFGGRKEATKRTTTAEETTFHLLHLSLMREYINYEFMELDGKLPFKYDVENIIDDWVLMGFLVGNDFIPHLPTLHINKDALPILFDTYKSVMPTLDGYLNEGGKLNLVRFEKFMAKLAEYDVENFNDLNADLKFFESKRSNNTKTATQRAGELENFFEGAEGEDDGMNVALEDVGGPGGRVGVGDSVSVQRKQETLAETYSRLGISEQLEYNDPDETEEEEQDSLVEEFRQHKRNYYIEKMHYKDEDNFKLVAHSQALNYVRGIQWILHYYYNGIASWSWYYPFHYAPYISDIKNFSSHPIKFDIGKPFQPFDQLLGVLPPLSVKLLPKCYHSLMLNEESPVIDFYPRTFETDLNGKQQDWEAVVLIPFIDEKRLLEAMATMSHRLTADERRRTAHGPMFVYTFTEENLGPYQSPGIFPNVSINHAQLTTVFRSEWEIPVSSLRMGPLPGVRMDLYFVGFPTLRHLEHTVRRDKAAVKVFQQASRSENFILDVPDTYATDAEDNKQWLEDIGRRLINSTVFVDWPHLKEAKVVGVSSKDYSMSVKPGTTDGDGGGVIGPVTETDASAAPGEGGGRRVNGRARFDSEVRSLSSQLLNRWGINSNDTTLLLYCKPMSGRRYIPAKDGRMTLSHDWSHIVQPYLGHVVVQDITVFDPGHASHRTVREHFPDNCRIFMLGQPHYGSCGTVLPPKMEQDDRTRVRLQVDVYPEPDLSLLKTATASANRYMTGYQLAQKLGTSPHLVIRMTGSVLMVPPQDPSKPFLEPQEYRNKVNIGLNLRNNKRNEEVRGLSQRDNSNNTWLYSEACLKLLSDYYSRYSHVFQFMNSQTGDFYQHDLFPGPDGPAKCAELLAWLRESEAVRGGWQRCGTEQLSEEGVAELLEKLEQTSLQQTVKLATMQVKPHLLYKPNPLQGSTPVDGPVRTELWDRVINVRDGYSVPLGARGTVVGIQPAKEPSDVLYDVVMDRPFPCGMSFAGPAAAQRCYRLYWSAFINLSAKTRPAGAPVSSGRHSNRGDQHSRHQSQEYGNGHSQQWRQGGGGAMPSQDRFQSSWSSAGGRSQQQRGGHGGRQSSERHMGRQQQQRQQYTDGGVNQPERDQRSAWGRGDANHPGNNNNNNNAGRNNGSDWRTPPPGSSSQGGSPAASQPRVAVARPAEGGAASGGSQGGGGNYQQFIERRDALLKEQQQKKAEQKEDSLVDQSNLLLQSLSNSLNEKRRQLDEQHQQRQEERSCSPQPPDPADLPCPAKLKPNMQSLGTTLASSFRSNVKTNNSDRNAAPVAAVRSTDAFADEKYSPQERLQLGLGNNKISESNIEPAPAEQHHTVPAPRHSEEAADHNQQKMAQHHQPQPAQPHAPPAISRGGVTNITHASQVECIVHGTYFSRWSVMQQYGLNKGNSQHIPCLSYDPLTSPRARENDKGYQLLIYLDVDHCLAAGVRFLVLAAGQVLCTGDANGKVPTHLFDRVLDTSRNKVIFPVAPSPALPSGGQSNWGNWNSPNGSVSPFMPTQVIKRVSTKSNKKKQQTPQKQTVNVQQQQAQKEEHLQEPGQPSSNVGIGQTSASEVGVNKTPEVSGDGVNGGGEVPMAMLVNLDASPCTDRRNAAKKKSPSAAGEASSDLPAPSASNKKKRGRRLACNFSN